MTSETACPAYVEMKTRRKTYIEWEQESRERTIERCIKNKNKTTTNPLYSEFSSLKMLFICFVKAKQSCRIIDIFTYISDKREMDSLIERMTPREKKIFTFGRCFCVQHWLSSQQLRLSAELEYAWHTRQMEWNETNRRKKIIVKFNLFITLSFRIFSTVFFSGGNHMVHFGWLPSRDLSFVLLVCLCVRC